MPAVEKKVWTSEDVRALREAKEQRPFEPYVRYEVVDGELFVTPAPRPPHQFAAKMIDRALDDYVTPLRLGWTLANAADVEMDDLSNVQPDVLVAPLVNGRWPQTYEEVRDLLLVVEILSPGTARADRGKKRLRYQRARIPEYWIVDLEARLVERWRPDDERPELVTETLVWHPVGAAEPLTIDLPRLFAKVWSEEAPAD